MSIKSVIRRNIKARARDMLRGSWGAAILIFVLVSLVTLGFNMLQMGLQSALGLSSVDEVMNNFEPSNVNELFDMFRMLSSSYILSLVMGVLAFLVMAPLSFGQTDWFMQLMSGTRQDVSYVFNWLGDGKKYLRSLMATFLVNLKSFLWMLPFTIISLASSLLFAVLLIGSADHLLGLYVVMFLLLLIFLIVGAVLMTIFLQRYLLVPYLSIRFPEMRMREVFRRSITMMNGHKGESLVFVLSFIGWYLLLLPSCGFITLYIYPYLTASKTLFAYYVMDTYSVQNSIEVVANGEGSGAAAVYELPNQLPENQPDTAQQNTSYDGSSPSVEGSEPNHTEPADGDENTNQNQE